MNKKKILRLLGSFAVFFLLMNVIYILCIWYPLTDGPAKTVPISAFPFHLFVFMLPIFLAGLAAYVVVPISLIICIFVKGKARSVLLVICAIFCMAFMTNKLSRTITWKIRRASLMRISQRGEVIIQAIESYRAKEQKPPESLDVLVPEYIDKIPGTGIRAYPAFEYRIPKNIHPHEKEILEELKK